MRPKTQFSARLFYTKKTAASGKEGGRFKAKAQCAVPNRRAN
jgi:hypothetical protein